MRVGVNGTDQAPAVRIVVDGPFADSLKVIFCLCLVFRIVVSKAHKLRVRRKIHEDGCIPVFHTGVLPVQQVRVEVGHKIGVRHHPAGKPQITGVEDGCVVAFMQDFIVLVGKSARADSKVGVEAPGNRAPSEIKVPVLNIAR